MSSIDITMARSWFGTKQVKDKLDYDANSNAIYIGYAPAGVMTSQPLWIIYNLLYDASNRYIGSNVSNFGVAWDDRVTLVYS